MKALVWSDEIEEKNEHGDQVVGTVEGTETLLGFIPCFELLIKAFNEVVGDIVFETVDTDMRNILQDGLNRNSISMISVTDKAGGASQVLDGMK